jgi:phosphoglycolate phosphatase
MIANAPKLHILFDLDGTLTEPKEGITKSIRYSLEKLNEEIPENLDWCIGPPLHDCFRKLLTDTSEASVQNALKLYRERFATIGWRENKVYPRIPETLDFLIAQGHELYIASSKPTIYIHKILPHFDLAKYFKSVYGSELDGTRSNKAELIAYILQQESIAADKTFMIGDREHDVIGARENNIRTLAVSYGYGSYEELQNCNPMKILTSPQAICEHFNETMDYF